MAVNVPYTSAPPQGINPGHPPAMPNIPAAAGQFGAGVGNLINLWRNKKRREKLMEIYDGPGTPIEKGRKLIAAGAKEMGELWIELAEQENEIRELDIRSREAATEEQKVQLEREKFAKKTDKEIQGLAIQETTGMLLDISQKNPEEWDDIYREWENVMLTNAEQHASPFWAEITIIAREGLFDETGNWRAADKDDMYGVAFNILRMVGEMERNAMEWEERMKQGVKDDARTDEQKAIEWAKKTMDDNPNITHKELMELWLASGGKDPDLMKNVINILGNVKLPETGAMAGMRGTEQTAGQGNNPNEIVSPSPTLNQKLQGGGNPPPPTTGDPEIEDPNALANQVGAAGGTNRGIEGLASHINRSAGKNLSSSGRQMAKSLSGGQDMSQLSMGLMPAEKRKLHFGDEGDPDRWNIIEKLKETFGFLSDDVAERLGEEIEKEEGMQGRGPETRGGLVDSVGSPISSDISQIVGDDDVAVATVNAINQAEGFEAKPGKHFGGKDTVGYGTLLPLTEEEKGMVKDPNNITEEEAAALRDHRLTVNWSEAVSLAKMDHDLDLNRLPPRVKAALMEVAYVTGGTGLADKLIGFKKMMAALKEQNYEQAAVELLQSKMVEDKQISASRARRLADAIEALSRSHPGVG